MSRGNDVNSVPITAGAGKTLQILVENQGRINYASGSDFKGIIKHAYYQGHILCNWTITGFSLEDTQQINDLLPSYERSIYKQKYRKQSILRNGPVFYRTTFDILNDEIYDTYIDTSGWGKVRSIDNNYKEY